MLRRALTVILAITPLLASADLCTVGALTGRAGMACPMESAGRVASAPASACPHCTPGAPMRAPARPPGPSCCDLRPQAAGAAATLLLAAPQAGDHQAVAPAAVDPAAAPVFALRSESDDGRAPPGPAPLLHSPRAPPLG
jgi:hypothetical protein